MLQQLKMDCMTFCTNIHVYQIMNPTMRLTLEEKLRDQ